MSKSSYVLKIQKGGTVYTCDLYDTPEEARGVTQSSPLFRCNIGGINLYASSIGVAYSDFSLEGTPLAIYNDGRNTFYVCQRSYFKISITTKANETITVTASNKPLGESGTGSFSFTSGTKYFPYGTTWTATVAGATGWNAGALSPGSSGTLTNANVTVTAGAATQKTFTLKCNSVANQAITLKYKKKNADGTFAAEATLAEGSSATVTYGTTWTASVSPSTGWNAGALSPGTSGTVTANTTVTAAAATHKTYVLTLAAESHQTITLYYKNHNGSALATSWTKKTSTSSAQTFTLGHGSKWYATVAGATGWNAGTISGAGSSSSPNTLTAAHTVNASAATHKTFTLKSTSEANQTLTVKYKNYNGTSFAAEKTLAEGDSVTVGYGTTWTATLTASAGYTKGTLSPGSSGTVKGNVTVSATAAYKPTVTIKIVDNTSPDYIVSYTNTSGVASEYMDKAGTYSFQINSGTKVSFYNTESGAAYIKQDGVSKGSIGHKATWTSGAITTNTTIAVNW